ncbi:MAG: dihydroorotate dehydrogenase electron transfer subunit [Clostridiales bacterium]|jgi:dihydroorotate dehydrogenase electron transfer subunit|nr:dihydroorotate dehydrogenase electron transfer subunit [Clostridiales bacterium]
MLKTADFVIAKNRALNQNVYEMVLTGAADFSVAAGQFVNLSLPGKFLRRPFGVCDYTADSITLLYKVAGGGTADMAAMAAGTVLNVMLPLGNGFTLGAIPAGTGDVLLAAGGTGAAPIYCLTKTLIERGFRPRVALGFNGRDDAFYLAEFRALAADVEVYSVSGELGEKGFPTRALEKEPGYYFACGPQGMLDAFAGTGLPGQLSYESRMGCGFGVCMGCTMVTRKGARRICADGPVFLAEDILL